MKKNDFLWFQNWYLIHCNGDWERDKRIHLKTLDNPGWLLTIDLKNTELENQKFQEIKINQSKNNWFFCAVRNNKFEGACGSTNLSEILKIFQDWAENFLDDEDKQRLKKCQSKEEFIEEDNLAWLQNWYHIHCNGDWEHSFGIDLEMLDTPAWLLKINLEATELENKIFQKVEVARTETDWVVCIVKGLQFEGACSPTNLYEVLKIFRDWAENFLIGPDLKRLELLKNKRLYFMEYDDFAWLQKWYFIHCDEGLEHSKRIRLETIDNPGWLLTINLEDTALADQVFQEIKIARTENEWMFCTVRNNKFEGTCGPANLPEVLKLFREWSENHQ